MKIYTELCRRLSKARIENDKHEFNSILKEIFLRAEVDFRPYAKIHKEGNNKDYGSRKCEYCGAEFKLRKNTDRKRFCTSACSNRYRIGKPREVYFND